MNLVNLMGRIVRDPEVRYTQGEKSMAIARYTLAVSRKFKRDGEPDCDFINCVAFGKNGEFAEKYLHKGTKILVTGRIQTGSYMDKETGKKVYTTDIVVEEHEFAESKSSAGTGGGSSNRPETSSVGNDFMSIPDGIDEELPFN